MHNNIHGLDKKENQNDKTIVKVSPFPALSLSHSLIILMMHVIKGLIVVMYR